MLPPIRRPGVFFLAAVIAALATGPEARSFAAVQTTTFKSGIQILEVDARVFDAAGRFVSDLRREDFEVIENGAAQTIETFFLVGSGGSSAPTGQSSGQQRPAQTWIFVFDHRHLMPNGFVRARRALEDFLEERIPPGDLVGIVMRDKMLDNRITSVKPEFLAALATIRIPEDASSRAAGESQAELAGDSSQAGQQIRELLGTEASIDRERAARETLDTVEKLAEGLTRMNGPKTIVLFSDGFPLAKLENTVRTVVRRLNASGGRLYALDTRGLAGGPTDSLNTLSLDTGGRALFNINNIGTALDDVAAETRAYYVLGYYPAIKKYDGRYRAIEVRVKRPGLTVRARRGYLAVAPSRMLTPTR